jgi:transcriptional regulator
LAQHPPERIMYLPPMFRSDDLASQHEVMRRHPLGTLVTRSGEGLAADHIPFLVDAERGEKGVLRAHVARANPLWRTHPRGGDALVIFSGAERYISPSWYATKRETGKVVPTWNYVAVHASGPLVVFDDEAWLARQIAELTSRQEAASGTPWAVSDAGRVHRRPSADDRGHRDPDLPHRGEMEGKSKSQCGRSRRGCRGPRG